MALRIFNTLKKAKEPFIPRQPGKVGMYVCGVTVYDLSHIGHARALVVFDVIYRYLRYSGYDVTYVRNYTDVDDKIIARANEKNIPLDDSQLIAGGFSGIQILLSELVKTSESLQLIDYRDVKIMVEQGTNALFVLIIKEESSFLQYKLKLFAEEFQNHFEDLIEHWVGEIDVFTPTRALIQRIFELDINS